MKVYMIGDMTKDTHLFDFKCVEVKLKNNMNINVVNTAIERLHLEKMYNKKTTDEQYLRMSIPMLMTCTHYVTVRGYENSSLALFEKELAKRLNLKELSVYKL